MKRKLLFLIKIDNLKRIVFIFLTFSYFLQVPFRFLSSVIVPFAFLFILLSYKEWAKLVLNPLFSFYSIYIVISLLYSYCQGNPINKILRFTEILFILPLFFSLSCDVDNNFYCKVFIRIAFLKAIVVLIIYYIVIQTNTYKILRSYGQTNDWGDIYSLGSLYLTRVQVHGNGLLPLAVFFAWYKKDKLLFRISLVIAVLIAGNQAFLIGLFLILFYFLYEWFIYRKNAYVKRVLLILCGLLVAPFIIAKINSILEEKSVYSNIVRIEQAKILLKDNILSGNGIGNFIKAKTSTRYYYGDDYFEVQTLYIINQIGLIGYFLFLFLTFSLLLRKQNYLPIYIYSTYLAYSFFNPYCFDSTHMIAGILITKVLICNPNKEVVNFSGVKKWCTR